MQVAVNVSARQLRQVQFSEDVKAVLAESGLSPHRLELELELTESQLMANMTAGVEAMRQRPGLPDRQTDVVRKDHRPFAQRVRGRRALGLNVDFRYWSGFDAVNALNAVCGGSMAERSPITIPKVWSPLVKT